MRRPLSETLRGIDETPPKCLAKTRRLDEPACKPDSVTPCGAGDHPSATTVSGGLPRTLTRPACDRPGSSGGPPSIASADARGVLLVLLQVGFAVPRPSPAVRWSLTRAISPLPKPFPLTGPVFGRFVFCGTFPRVTPGGRYPPPCPLESGLSSMLLRRDHPADSSNSSFYVRNHSDRRGTYFRLNR